MVTKGSSVVSKPIAGAEGGNAPVRSISVMTRFLKTSGAFQRMLNAIMTPPAARRKKSRAPQRVINIMDTILVDCFHGNNPVNSSKVERRRAGGRQPSCVPCHHAVAVPRRLT